MKEIRPIPDFSMRKPTTEGQLKPEQEKVEESFLEMVMNDVVMQEHRLQQVLEKLRFAIEKLPPHLQAIEYGLLEETERALANQLGIAKSTVHYLHEESLLRLGKILDR